MSSYQNSPVAAQQVYQSVQQPLHDNQWNKPYRNGAKHYYTYVDNQNKIDYNHMKMSAQPYIIQTRSIVGSLQNNRVNSANTRSATHKKQSSITNSHFSQTEKKQTLLHKTTNTNSMNKITQQPSYSTLNQQQSTVQSTNLQYSNNNTQSQQLPFTIPQMSQILSGSQISQSSLSRNSQQKPTIIGQSGFMKQKSQFLQSLKRKNSDDSSDNEIDNEPFQFPSEIRQEGGIIQNSISPLKRQESIQWDGSRVTPSIGGMYSSCTQKEKEQLNMQSSVQRSGQRQPSQYLQRFGSLDSKNQLNLQSSNLDQHKYHFYKPAPLQKQPKNTELPPENQGDQQISFYEESLTMTSLQQSAMIESTKIRERSIGSFLIDIKGTRLTKRLLDLQEPRNIQEEEEEETCTNCQTNRSDNGIERSHSQQFEAHKNPEYGHKYKKYSCDIKQMSPTYIDIDNEIDGRDQNIEEFSPHQKPPSMASINNQQMNRDWSNSKSPKDRRTSTLSIDYRYAQVSTNETLQSFCNNVKINSQGAHQQSGMDKILKKAQPILEASESTENQNRERRSSSANNIADQIPDEPEKTQILRTFYMAGNRIPVVKLSQINKNNFNNGDKYFIPTLLKSFKGEKDKLSNLYKQYFQKMYYNLQVNPKLETKYHQVSPVFLPTLPPNKKTIFFDLDETLIHCIDIFTDPQQYQQFTQSNMTMKNSGSTSRNSESCNEVLCNIQCSPFEQIQCLFSIRPYARQILQELAKDFELILLTAARKIYADAVLEKLDPENKIFSHKFYRECCIEFMTPNPSQQQAAKKTYLKDLRVFQNRKLENVILVDNSPLSYLNQITNGIPILDYCNNNKNDDELLHLCSYLKTLINVSDVREHIKHKFLLKQYRAFPNIESLQNYIIEECSH